MHALNFDYSFELSCDIDDDLLFEIQWWDKFEAEIQAPFIVGMEGLWSAIWKFISSIFRKLKSLFSSENFESIAEQTNS